MSSAGCLKNIGTADPQTEETAIPEAPKESMVIKKGLSIEDYLKSQKEKELGYEDGIVAESLWDERYGGGYLFVDHKARKVGDVITILIVENASASKNASTQTSRDSSMDSKIDSLFGVPSNFGMKNFMGLGQPFSPNVKGEFAGSFNGSGSTSRSGRITATISAEVLAVLPNGNLKIFGHREIKVNEENQIITIAGTIRPQDIDESNSVRSTSIAEAKIQYYGNGIIARKQKEGWLAKFLDVIWPF
jgi:flagellar L-ring protein precursor FlgH